MTAARGRPGGLRILVLVQGNVGERMSGPEIRGWQLATALADGHAVTAAVRRPDAACREGVRLVGSSRRRLASEAVRHEVIIAPSVPPYLFGVKLWRSTLILSDQYDPVELELGTLGEGRAVARAVGTARAARRLQLRFADVVLCANERQRQWLGEGLAGMPKHRGGDTVVRELPFGLPPPAAPSDRRPLRQRFPQIRDGDTIVLWWGKVWRWFDAETAIRSLAPLARSRPDIKLVITAGKSPDAGKDRFSASEDARGLARSLGVLGSTVLFIDEWLPYAERHHYLGEADIGLTLHRDTPEAPLAARARYLDYLWASLPCVLGRGDEVAERFERAGFATLVPPNDPAAVRAALLALADDRDALERARRAAVPLVEGYRWEALVRPLADELATMAPRPTLRGADALDLARYAVAYYARRAGDKLLACRAASISRSAWRRSTSLRW